MKKIKWFAVLMLIALPIALYAGVISVGEQAASIEEAVMMADDGDVIVVDDMYYLAQFDNQDKDLYLVITALPPEDEDNPDSSVYGPKFHFPPTPLE